MERSPRPSPRTLRTQASNLIPAQYSLRTVVPRPRWEIGSSKSHLSNLILFFTLHVSISSVKPPENLSEISLSLPPPPSSIEPHLSLTAAQNSSNQSPNSGSSILVYVDMIRGHRQVTSWVSSLQNSSISISRDLWIDSRIGGCRVSAS